MTFKGLRDADFDAWMGLHQLRHQRGKIAFEVDTESQEIGDDYDLAHALSGQAGDSAGKIGLAQFEECGFDVRKISSAGKAGGNLPHALVGGFDAGAMREDHESAHTGG
jgi:hypothetical protein